MAPDGAPGRAWGLTPRLESEQEEQEADRLTDLKTVVLDVGGLD